MYFSANQVSGHSISVNTTHSKHIASTEVENPNVSKHFGSLLEQALSDVNTLQQEAVSLNQQMLIDPDSIDTHDVTLALGKANLAVSITKAVADGALKAYREIISIR